MVFAKRRPCRAVSICKIPIKRQTDLTGFVHAGQFTGNHIQQFIIGIGTIKRYQYVENQTIGVFAGHQPKIVQAQILMQFGNHLFCHVPIVVDSGVVHLHRIHVDRHQNVQLFLDFPFN